MMKKLLILAILFSILSGSIISPTLSILTTVHAQDAQNTPNTSSDPTAIDIENAREAARMAEQAASVKASADAAATAEAAAAQAINDCQMAASVADCQQTASVNSGAVMAANAQKTGDYKGCSLGDGVSGVIDGVLCFLIRETVLRIVAGGLYIAAKSFDLVVNLSLFDLNRALANSGNSTDGAIYKMWSTVRDLCNIVGIFFFFISVIYIIIGKGLETRKYLVKLILFAILLNFSFPISKAVLDFSNVFALNIYGAVSGYKYKDNPAATGYLANDYGISYELMQIIGLQSPVTKSGEISTEAPVIAGIGSTVTMLALVIMICALAVVFVQATLVFATRTVLMLGCIITSPIMFMGGILPPNKLFNLDEWVEGWTSRFFSGAFAAPIMMINLGLALQIMKFVMGMPERRLTSDYLPKLIFMFITILVFQKAVEYSANMMDEMGKRAAAVGGKLGAKMMSGTAARPLAFAGRQTFGRAASAIMQRTTRDGGWLRSQADKGGGRGRLASAVLQNIEGADKRVRSSSFNALGAAVNTVTRGKVQMMTPAGGLDRDSESFQQFKDQMAADRASAAANKEGARAAKATASKDAHVKDLKKNETALGTLQADKDELKKELTEAKYEIEPVLRQIEKLKLERDKHGDIIGDQLKIFKNTDSKLKNRLDNSKDEAEKLEIAEYIKYNKIQQLNYENEVGIKPLMEKETELGVKLNDTGNKIFAKNADIVDTTEKRDTSLEQVESMRQLATGLSLNAQALKDNAKTTEASVAAARVAYKAKYKGVDDLLAASNNVSESVIKAFIAPIKPQKSEMAQILEALKKKGVPADKAAADGTKPK